MSNFKNFRKSRATNTSWRSGSDSGDSTIRSHNLSWATTSSSTVSSSISNNQHHNRPILLQRSSTPIPITTSSASAYPTSDSSSPTLESSDSGSGYFYPSQGYLYAHVPQYLLSRLSTDSSSDRRYSSRKNGKHNSNNHENQRTHKTRSRDPPQPSSGSSSSTESSVSSGNNRNFQLQSPRIRRGHPVDSSSSTSGSRRNFPPNHRNAWGFGRNPVGMAILNPATHFVTSQHFNAPPASSLPQPPQIWLFGRTEDLVKEEDIEEERVMAKIANTYDYYNLKILLSCGT